MLDFKVRPEYKPKNQGSPKCSQGFRQAYQSSLTQPPAPQQGGQRPHETKPKFILCSKACFPCCYKRKHSGSSGKLSAINNCPGNKLREENSVIY